MTTLETIKRQVFEDLILYANDLAEYKQTRTGREVNRLFWASTWGNLDIPESMMFWPDYHAEYIPESQLEKLQQSLIAYFNERNEEWR